MDRKRLIVIVAALAAALILARYLLEVPAPPVEITAPEQTAPPASPSEQPQ